VIMVNVSHGLSPNVSCKLVIYTHQNVKRRDFGGRSGVSRFSGIRGDSLRRSHVSHGFFGPRGLLGHSYGGLFAIYAPEQRPALFQGS